jgi:hypothetical protein
VAVNSSDRSAGVLLFLEGGFGGCGVCPDMRASLLSPWSLGHDARRGRGAVGQVRPTTRR